MPRRIAVLFAVAVLTLMSGCSLFTPVKMEMSPNSAVMFVGESLEFSAVGILPSGSEILQHNFIWELSSDIGTLSASTGVNTIFTGQKAGSSTLTVYNYDRKVFASAPVEVKDLPVLDNIVVEPASCTVGDGIAQEFTAISYDQYSQPFAVTLEWSLTGGIGTLSASSGISTVLTAANSGSSDIVGTVVASSGSISGYSEITVTPSPPRLARIEVVVDKPTITLGETCGLFALGYDQYGNPFAITPQWSAPGDLKGTFDTLQGTTTVFHPTLAQNVSVYATSGSVSGTAIIAVQPILSTYQGRPLLYFRIPDNGTLTYRLGITDANPKARIRNVLFLGMDGKHENPSETTAWCEAKDKDGNLHRLPVINSKSTSLYFSWSATDIGDKWAGLPVNMEYTFYVNDNAIGNTGEIWMLSIDLLTLQTEL